MAKSVVSSRPIGVAALCVAYVLAIAAPAQATPVTIDFESGATLNEAVTNQYGPPTTPAGPTFMRSSEAGLHGVECSPPRLVNAYMAHSGSSELKLDGCEGGEFWPSDAFFTLGYSTEKVEFWVASDTPLASATVTSTAFTTSGGSIQHETIVPGNPEPTYVPVTLESPSGDIDAVAIQLGKNFGTEPNSSTGVTEGHGNTDLLVDDLTYYPPSSPPSSSFRLGANPAAIATTAGNQVSVKIPVTWTNNPEPASSPVEFEASTPTGVEASFSPNPSSSGTTTMTLKIAKKAAPQQTSVTVTGYVEKGKVGEKTASVEIPVGISSALELSGVENLTLAPCSPRQVQLHVRTPSYVTEPVTFHVVTVNQPGVTISSISNGTVLAPGEAEATVTPKNGEATATLTLSVAPGVQPAPGQAWAVSVSAGEYGAQYLYGNLAIEAGRINEADIGQTTSSSAVVETPGPHRPGSQLTLRGAGFCPGSRVAIGDESEGAETDNLATPESISAAGTALTFRVPRGAVSGPIKVLAPGGLRFEGASQTVRSFRNTYGFSWVNRDYGMRMNDELGDELFGVHETNFEPIPGWLVRKPEAVLFEAMTNKHIPGGICFGMAYTSLEFYEFPGESARFPHTGGTDAWHLDSPSAPSEPLLRQVTENFSLQFTDQLIPAELNTVLGIHGTNDAINTIEEELSAGRPVLLGLIHFGNILEGGSLIEGHTVLAYDARPLPGGGTAVYVANSNVPYSTEEETNFGRHDSSQFTRSEVIIKEGNWEFPEGAEFEHSGGKPWTGSEAGLVVYRHHELPIINGEQPHLPNVVTAALMSFGSSADNVTQLSGGHGSLISGNELAPASAWPKGVAPLPNFNSRSSPLQLFSFDPKTTGPLTATVARSSDGGAMTFNLPGLQGNLEAGTQSGQVDHVAVDPRSDALGYQTSATRTPLRGTLLSAPRASHSGTTRAGASKSGRGGKSLLTDHLAQFRLTSNKSGGEQVALRGGRQFVLRHRGAPTRLALTLSAFAASGQPIAVQLPPIRVGSGGTVSVAPSNWRKLGSARIRVSVSGHGHKSVQHLRGRPLGKGFARVRKAKLVSLGGHHYRLDLVLSMHHAPKEGRLSVAARVLLHGHQVAQAAGNQLHGSLRGTRTVPLPLLETLKPGRYTLALRLLEVTASGAVQGSKVLTQTLPVRAPDSH